MTVPLFASRLPWSALMAAVLLVAFAVPAFGAVSLRVGVYENKPIVFHDADGSARGFAIDMLEYAAEERGWELVYVGGTWSECLERLKHGEIDLLPAIAYSPARAEYLSYCSQSLLTNWGQIFVGRGSTVSTPLDLEGLRVGLLRGDIYNPAFRELMDKFGVHVRIEEYDGYAQAFEALARGDIDAAVANRILGTQHQREYGLQCTPILFNPIEIRYAMARPGDLAVLGALDSVLLELRQNPESVYHRSMDRWFGSTGRWTMPQWLHMTLLVAGMALAALFISSLVLRRQVSLRTAQLAQRNQELSREVADRRQAENRLSGLVHEKDMLLQEVHHRVKNNLQVVMSLLRLQADASGDEAAEAMLQESLNRVASMAMVHETLYRSEDFSGLDLGEYLGRLVRELSASLGGGEVQTDLPEQGLHLPLDQVVPCGLIANELVTNAFKHAYPGPAKGPVRLALARDGNLVRLVVADQGAGLPPDMNLRKVSSLGLMLVQNLVDQLGGEIEAVPLDGGGTEFVFSFPLVRD